MAAKSARPVPPSSRKRVAHTSQSWPGLHALTDTLLPSRSTKTAVDTSGPPTRQQVVSHDEPESSPTRARTECTLPGVKDRPIAAS
jgi:hypothetical protein